MSLLVLLAIVLMVVYWLGMFIFGWAMGADDIDMLPWVVIFYFVCLIIMFYRMTLPGYNIDWNVGFEGLGWIGLGTIAFFGSSIGSGYLLGRCYG